MPQLTSAEESGQRRRLRTKTIVQQRKAYVRKIPLFHCLIICLHSAFSEKNFGRSVISFASLRYVRLATNISAERFSLRIDYECLNILGALLYIEKN